MAAVQSHLLSQGLLSFSIKLTKLLRQTCTYKNKVSVPASLLRGLGLVCSAGRVVPPSNAVLRHGLVHLQGPSGRLCGSPGILLLDMGFKDPDVTQIPLFFLNERTVSMLHIRAAIGRSWHGFECPAKVPVLCGCADDGRYPWTLFPLPRNKSTERIQSMRCHCNRYR